MDLVQAKDMLYHLARSINDFVDFSKDRDNLIGQIDQYMIIKGQPTYSSWRTVMGFCCTVTDVYLKDLKRLLKSAEKYCINVQLQPQMSMGTSVHKGHNGGKLENGFTDAEYTRYLHSGRDQAEKSTLNEEAWQKCMGLLNQTRLRYAPNRQDALERIHVVTEDIRYRHERKIRESFLTLARLLPDDETNNKRLPKGISKHDLRVPSLQQARMLWENAMEN